VPFLYLSLQVQYSFLTHPFPFQFNEVIPLSPVDFTTQVESSNMKFTIALFSLLAAVAIAAPSTFDSE
jgi:hypothetical protein